MDLTTRYMGLTLKNPLVPSASPLSRDLDTAKQIEDNGAAAIVLYSLFEEQILAESRELNHFLAFGSEGHAEALDYFPPAANFPSLGADEYLNQIRQLKSSLSIPVIASLNGVSPGGWMRYAKMIEEAGADAIELNLYYIPTDPALDSNTIEKNYIDAVRFVKESTSLPVAVKLSPYFTALAHLISELEKAGADAAVLFNRFYQPDINIEKLEVAPNLMLSTQWENRLPMRWMAILHGQTKMSLAATSGIHTSEDMARLILAGADVTMMASRLLSDGVGVIGDLLKGLETILEKHEYKSIDQMRGAMSLKNIPHSAAYERANYMKVLHSIRYTP